MFSRLQTLLSGLWLGSIFSVGALAAPNLFAVLERAMAGLVAGRLFAAEAQASLVLAMLLFFIERRRVRDARDATVMSAELLLVLGALFCTVLGHFALQPMMEAAKAGQGPWSFGNLHAVSTVLFGLKGLLVLTLCWRLTGRGAPTPAASA